MDFHPNEEQRELSAAVHEFGRSLNEHLIQRDADAVFDRDRWRRCAEFGIQGLPVPPEYGGSGQNLMTTLLAMEALGYACRDNHHVNGSPGSARWRLLYAQRHEDLYHQRPGGGCRPRFCHREP